MIIIYCTGAVDRRAFYVEDSCFDQISIIDSRQSSQQYLNASIILEDKGTNE